MARNIRHLFEAWGSSPVTCAACIKPQHAISQSKLKERPHQYIQDGHLNTELSLVTLSICTVALMKQRPKTTIHNFTVTVKRCAQPSLLS